MPLATSVLSRPGSNVRWGERWLTLEFFSKIWKLWSSSNFQKFCTPFSKLVLTSLVIASLGASASGSASALVLLCVWPMFVKHHGKGQSSFLLFANLSIIIIQQQRQRATLNTLNLERTCQNSVWIAPVVPFTRCRQNVTLYCQYWLSCSFEFSYAPILALPRSEATSEGFSISNSTCFNCFNAR